MLSQRCAWLVVLLLSVSSSLRGQTSQPEVNNTLPTFRSSTRVVIVDVVVTGSKREPVTGLGKDDFVVSEDGHAQTVSFFEEHSAETPTPATLPPLPPNVFTNFPVAKSPDAVNVLLLDALNTPTADQIFVHRQILKYLKGIRPGPRLAIFTLGSQLRMVQPFTSDPAVLLAVLNEKNPESSVLLRTPSDTSAEQMPINQLQAAAAEHPAPELLAMLAALRQFQAESNAFQLDQRVRLTLGELQQLSRFLGKIAGRKNVIWFSGSFPFNVFADSGLLDPSSVERQYETEVHKTADELCSAQMAIYPVAAEGLTPNTLEDASNVIGGVTNTRTAIQHQSRGLQDESQQRNGAHDTMDELAKDTGGKAFYNTNGLNDALASAVRDGSHYYTLTYTPTNKTMDGRYRHIQVKLKQGKYKLAYRRGYNAESPETAKIVEQKLSADPLQPLMAANMPNFSEILYTMRVLPLPGAAGAERAGDNAKMEGPVARYSVDFAASLKDLQLEAAPDGSRRCKLEVTLLAYAFDGTPMNWIVRTLQPSLKPEEYLPATQHGLQLHFEIDVPKDTTFLRTGIYDLASNKAGTVEIPLTAVKAATPAN